MAELWVIVMRNNILNHFALNDLKNHKKDTHIMFITLTILSLIMFMITFLSPLLLNSYVLEYKEREGYYDYVIGDSYSKEEKDHISKDEIMNSTIHINQKQYLFKDAPLSYAIVYDIGTTLTGDSIHYVEGNLKNISVNLENGRMPTNENEFVVKKEVLNHFGYNISLNQFITVPYYYQNGDHYKYGVREGKVVGFLKETGQSSILVGNYDESCSINIYFSTNQHEDITTTQYEITKTEEQFYIDKQLDTLVIIIEFVLFIVGNFIVSGLTIASFDNRQKDYTLLRGLGATKRQLYYVVFVQSLILSICSLCIASILYLGLGILFQNLLQSKIILEFHSQYYLGVVGITIITVLISYFIPARASCRSALTGSFEGNEFQYFYYRYKKLHYMRPIYLGWRHIVGRKKQMFVKILLILIVTISSLIIIGDKISYDYSIAQKNLDALDEYEHSQIYLDYGDYSEIIPDLKIFDVYKQYAQDILYVPYIDDDSALGEMRKIYKYNDDTKQLFHLKQEIKPGNIIVSSQISNKKQAIRVYDSEYSIIDVIESEDSFIIMCEDDLQRYNQSDPKMLVRIYFNNIHDKTKGLIAFANQKLNGFYSCHDSLLETSQSLEMLYQYGKYTPSLFLIALMIGAGVIYVYQLAYEVIKEKENIGTYQLLGLRKREIWWIYASKSFLIAAIGFMIGILYYFANLNMDEYYHTIIQIFISPVALISQIGISLLIIIMLIFLSLLPIYSLLRKDGLENKHLRE